MGRDFHPIRDRRAAFIAPSPRHGGSSKDKKAEPPAALAVSASNSEGKDSPISMNENHGPNKQAGPPG